MTEKQKVNLDFEKAVRMMAKTRKFQRSDF